MVPGHMLTTTHLALAILIGLLLNLDRNEWFVALSFGIVIDVDHLFAAPRYVGDNGLGALLRPSWDDGSGLPWKSLLHDSMGSFVMIPLGVGWRYMVPLLFWALHVGLDGLQASLLAWNTPVESAFIIASCLGILGLSYRRWLGLNPEGEFKQFLTEAKTVVSAYFASFTRSLRKTGSTE